MSASCYLAIYLVRTSLWAAVYREIFTLHFQLLLPPPISHLSSGTGFFCWAVARDLSHLSLWTRTFQVPLRGIRLRLDRPNVTNGFKIALPGVGLHSPLDMDLDLLPLFSIKIYLHIWLSNWQLFLHFSHFVAMALAMLYVLIIYQLTGMMSYFYFFVAYTTCYTLYSTSTTTSTTTPTTTCSAHCSSHCTSTL